MNVRSNELLHMTILAIDLLRIPMHSADWVADGSLAFGAMQDIDEQEEQQLALGDQTGCNHLRAGLTPPEPLVCCLW